MQTGESFEQAKVFKAHAVPQGLCANLINALKLLANQQEDLMDGLRDFIRVDDNHALDVTPRHGNLKFGSQKFRKGDRM